MPYTSILLIVSCAVFSSVATIGTGARASNLNEPPSSMIEDIYDNQRKRINTR
jgi:hypothetical protein